MTDTDTLLPCPFCGGDARFIRQRSNTRVECNADECRATPLAGEQRDEQDAIAAWNRRTPPTPTTDEREAVARAIAIGMWGPDAASVYFTTPCNDVRYRDSMSAADAALSALAPFRQRELDAKPCKKCGNVG